MKTRRIKASQVRTGSYSAAVRITSSALTGLLWGIGWALCVETYQSNEGISLLGYALTRPQSFVLGIIAAMLALATVALVFESRRPFWQPLLSALSAAFITAILFYVALTALAALMPNVSPSKIEGLFLPLGWSIDNAALFLALQCIAPRHPRSHDARQRATTHIILRLVLFLLLVAMLWLFFFASRSFISIPDMVAIIPAIVWTGLAANREFRRNA